MEKEGELDFGQVVKLAASLIRGPELDFPLSLLGGCRHGSSPWPLASHLGDLWVFEECISILEYLPLILFVSLFWLFLSKLLLLQD